MSDLHLRYRPTCLKDLVGQPDAVRVIEHWLSTKDEVITKNGKRQRNHSLLLSGPTGCGKTTIARILKDMLNCADSDYVEINASSSRGIDTIRDVQQRMGLAPMLGECRIWLFDECHSLAPFAQQALLKMLEDTPNHVYFMLGSTDPHKLLKAIRDRCHPVNVVAFKPKTLLLLLKSVVKKERASCSDEVLEKIVDLTEGSARQALVLLGMVLGIEDEEEQLSILNNSSPEKQALEIARALLNPRAKWSEVARLIKEVNEDAEKLRRLILSFATTTLLGGGKLAPRAYLIIQAFRDHVFDSGKAGLAANAYEVVSNKT